MKKTIKTKERAIVGRDHVLDLMHAHPTARIVVGRPIRGNPTHWLTIPGSFEDGFVQSPVDHATVQSMLLEGDLIELRGRLYLKDGVDIIL